jgi:hypothetical protein
MWLWGLWNVQIDFTAYFNKKLYIDIWDVYLTLQRTMRNNCNQSPFTFHINLYYIYHWYTSLMNGTQKYSWQIVWLNSLQSTSITIQSDAKSSHQLLQQQFWTIVLRFQGGKKGYLKYDSSIDICNLRTKNVW